MAEIIVVDGPAQIRVGTGTEDALETLGFTENGAMVIENSFTGNVPGDQNGGVEGPPIDIQVFGVMHIVRLELSKWDPAVEVKLASRAKGVTAGTAPVVGKLYSAGDIMYRLLVAGYDDDLETYTNNPRNYLGAIPMGSWEINKGSKYSRRVMEFHCYTVGGVLFNNTTA